MIPEAAIRRHAGENRVDVAISRQEVVLTILLERLFTRTRLRDEVALKGGTALRKLVFGPGGRFSEDMDFVVLTDQFDDVQMDLMMALQDGVAAEADGIRVLPFDFEQSSQGTIQATCQFESERGDGRFELDITGGSDRQPLLGTILQPPLSQSYFDQLGFVPTPLRRMHTVEMIAEKLVSIHRRHENRNPKDVWDLWRWLQLPSAPAEMSIVARLWPVRLWLDGQRWRGPGWFDGIRSSDFDWMRLRPILPRGGVGDGDRIIGDIHRRIGPWIDEDEQLLSDAGSGRLREECQRRLESVRREHRCSVM